MSQHSKYDAIVVGSGPNGLAAAITLAQAGLAVAVFEAKETIGGGSRSMELTLPGFVHDVCSAVHPLALDSSFFRSLPLERYGLEMIQPPAPLAHPLDNGTAVMLERSIEATAAGLGNDAEAYRKLMTPLVANWDKIEGIIRAPLRPQSVLHPFARANFGLKAIRSARGLSESLFEGEQAPAIFATFNDVPRAASKCRSWTVIGDTWTHCRLADTSWWFSNDRRCISCSFFFPRWGTFYWCGGQVD